MKETGAGYKKEFEDMVGGNVLEATRQIEDPVAIGVMLYSMAEERKSTNLIIKDLNAKIDLLVNEMSKLKGREAPTQMPAQPIFNPSERDQEVLDYVKTKGKVCAEDMQAKFKYKGKNAASARLSKLYHEGRLEKEYAGRKVYYKIKK
jgi:hypothetical protein